MEDHPQYVLDGVGLFKGLSEPARTALIVAAQSHVYGRGELIVGEGQFGDRVFVIGRGSVDVVKKLGLPERMILDTLPEKHVFGEMCLIEGVLRSASVVAAEPVLIYSIHNSSIHKLAVFYPDDYAIIIQNVAKDLCLRLRKQDVAFAATAF